MGSDTSPWLPWRYCWYAMILQDQETMPVRYYSFDAWEAIPHHGCHGGIVDMPWYFRTRKPCRSVVITFDAWEAIPHHDCHGNLVDMSWYWRTRKPSRAVADPLPVPDLCTVHIYRFIVVCRVAGTAWFSQAFWPQALTVLLMPKKQLFGSGHQWGWEGGGGRGQTLATTSRNRQIWQIFLRIFAKFLWSKLWLLCIDTCAVIICTAHSWACSYLSPTQRDSLTSYNFPANLFNVNYIAKSNYGNLDVMQFTQKSYNAGPSLHIKFRCQNLCGMTARSQSLRHCVHSSCKISRCNNTPE
jgi:hypothetical protein